MNGIDPYFASRKLDILLAEYNALRADEINRAGTVYQLIGAGIAGCAALISLQMWALLGAIIVVAVLMIWCATTDVQHMSERAREIEREINSRAGEHLMDWETSRGGMFGRIFGYLWSN